MVLGVFWIKEVAPVFGAWIFTVNEHIAHKRKADGKCQSLESHLLEVGELASVNAGKVGLPEVGKLLGIMHDFGKYSGEFQRYIRSATGEVNPDEDDYVDARRLRGRIDHSTAGAQWVHKKLKGYPICRQILALCIASHHSGLIDCLKPDGTDSFAKRMNKKDCKTHLRECLENGAAEKILELSSCVANKEFFEKMNSKMKEIYDTESEELLKHFHIGFFVKFLFSCLVDADRLNSAEFEKPERKLYRLEFEKKFSWENLKGRMEDHLSKMSPESEIDRTRMDISNRCKERSCDPQGLYTLTVPTGGGKTLASLRYAIHHAEKHGLDRIIYIIPYTSIIEQNADAIRRAVEREGDQFPFVLEHHSSLEAEKSTWHNKLTSENWDSPIVLTTMVQFLEALFSGGTKGVRRMHLLAQSILVFDEIQTLPIKCVHLFCNALNFLVKHSKTTVVLCTATQPLLNKLKNPELGYLNIPEGNELMGNPEKVRCIFARLKRVVIKNEVCSQGWSEDKVAQLAMSELDSKGSCLVIVNTKKWAQSLYKNCKKKTAGDKIFHLSTNMCPAHRKVILGKIRKRLEKDMPVLCISTQLIEAGVDIDFASVIRFLSGLDSIAQAAGRCNRHNRRKTGTVYVVRPEDENIELMEDMREGIQATLRVFEEEGCQENGDLVLEPQAVRKYFEYYFYNRSGDMAYPVSEPRQDTLLNMLSCNPKNISTAGNLMRQSFMSAGEAFRVIDAPTKPIIVPYNQEGKNIIAQLCGAHNRFEPKTLKEAQKYSVNLFPHDKEKLLTKEAVLEIGEDGIYYLDKRYYSEEFGVSMQMCGNMDFAGV